MLQIPKYRDVDPHYTVFTFRNITPFQMAQLRRIMYDDIPSAAFDVMIINRNTSFTQEHTMMDYFNFVLLEVPDNVSTLNEYDSIGRFRITEGGGDKIVYSTDIKETVESNGIKIKNSVPLFWLRNNEEIDLVLYVRTGTGKEHVKFKVVTEVTPLKDDPFSMRVESTGYMSAVEIMNKAIEIYNSRQRD